MKVKNKYEVLKIIEENKNAFRGFGVKKIGVFGSFIRGEQIEESDIDLLVDFEEGKKTFRNFIDMAEYSENLLGRKVDLLTPNSLSPYIAPHIEKEIEYVQITS